MKSCSIKGLSYTLVKCHVTNGELSTFADANDKWISSKTGVRIRYISEEEDTSDLGARAAHMAIDKPSINPKEIDLVITITFTPDQTTPPAACLIQKKLGLNNQHMMVFDLNAVCNGFLYALQSAHAILAAGQVTRTPIIGAEIISKQLDWDDRSTCIIFADGVGAAIVRQEDTNKRTLYFAGSVEDTAGVVHNDVPKLGPLFSEQPYQPSVVYMEGNVTFRFAVKAMQKTIEDVLKQAGEHIEDIDWIVPHQADVRIINNVCKRMHIDKEYVYINIEGYGNASAASVPLTLGEMSERGLLQPGVKIVLSGFGTGFTWAGCYIELQGKLYVNK